MERSKVAIIIPAFNEEKSICAVIKSIKEYGQVIVVNDGSEDQTAREAQNVGAIVIDHKRNKGYDAALSTGFKKADEHNCKYAITFDADGQHDPKVIRRFIDLLDSQVDLVVGVRPKCARFSERIFAFYTNLFYGLKDPLCGLKGYTLRLYREQGFFDSYRSINTQLALFCIKGKGLFAQIPVPIHHRAGASRFGSIIKGNYLIMRSMVFSFFCKGRKKDGK